MKMKMSDLPEAYHFFKRAMNSKFKLAGVVIWIGILCVLSAPATAQSEADGAQKLHKAATDDINMLLAREQPWIGRPNAVQFTPMAGIASGFIPYDAGTVGADLLYYQKNMLELASTRAEGEEGFMLMAGLSATFQWSSWLGHTSRAFRVLHLEFLQLQNDLEEEWKEKISNHPDNPVPESFKEELRLQLGGQEKQAFNKLFAARAELAKELRKAKVDLAERIRIHVLRGDEANLMMAKTIFEIVTFENEWNEPFLMLGNTLMHPKYFQLSEEELEGMEDVRLLDKAGETQTLIASFIDYRSIEPIAPFAPAPRTYSVTSDKESYNSGDVVTINVQGSHEFTSTFRLEILETSTILTEDEIPGSIYEGRGDDPLEIDEREDIDDELDELGDPEKEYLELPATFPLRGNNPQIVIPDLPNGDFTALVMEERGLERTSVAETAFKIEGTKPVAYPQYTVYLPPTVPEIITWGSGIPGADNDSWLNLIPEDVVEGHKLDGRWILMAIHGQHLFDIEFEKPELTWAGGDKHLDYKLLHSGTYSTEKLNGIDDQKWLKFWQGLDIRSVSNPSLRIEHSDVYIVAVHLAPNTWAGKYGFKLGDLAINWTLPHATNIAETRFVRTLGIGRMVPNWYGAVAVEAGPDGKKMLYEKADALFKYDRFFVEIETTGDVITSDRIPFDLYSSKAGGAAKPIDFGAHPLYAVRVDGNRRLFRSPLIRLNNPRATAGTSVDQGRRIYWVSLEEGDRLAARVMPHDVARQGLLATAKIYTTPDRVSAFWREAVNDAAKIAKIKPSTPIERMGDGELYTSVLLKPWETVDSTPFVQIGGREIQLTVEHLAAMLMIRKQFIASMEEALPRLQKMREKMNANPGWKHTVWVMLKADAEREGTPLGDLPVLDWDPVRRTTIMGQTVPYRNAYDEEWLDKTFRGLWSHRIQWQHDMAMFVFNGYVGAAEQALDYARNMDVTKPSAEGLLRLTTLGMRPMVKRLRPNMLKLEEDKESLNKYGIGFKWTYERHGRQSVSLIEQLGDEFLKNEARVDAINSATALVAGVIAILLPETTICQIIAAGLGAGSAMITLTHELPEFIGREEDVRFALGAYLVVGEQRYFTANKRRMSGWALALSLAGATLDIRAALVQIRHARAAWVALRPDVEVAAAFAKKPQAFVELPVETQKSALLRLAQLSDMQSAGKALTPIEANILQSGTAMLDDMGTFGYPEMLRYIDPDKTGRLELIVMRDGSIGYMSPTPRKLNLSDTLNPEELDALEAAAKAAEDLPELRIPHDQPWHEFDVKGYVSQGAYAEVFKIPLDSKLEAICNRLGLDASGEYCALKVYEAGQNGIDDVQRSLKAQAILEEAGIPQLRIIDHGVGPDNMAYVVQEFMPAPGIYKPVAGEMMDVEMQKALLELHEKMGQKGIALSDGYNKNLYFGELENGKMICGILDQDRVWKYGEGLESGVWGPEAMRTTLFILENPTHRNIPHASRIWSLKDCEYTPAAKELFKRGYCPWPDEEYFMMKMLEHRGWIRFDTKAGKFVSDRMDIELVETYFKKLNHPDNINTKFDVPEHLQHLLPDLPPGGDPIPFPEPIAIMQLDNLWRCNTGWRIAA